LAEAFLANHEDAPRDGEGMKPIAVGESEGRETEDARLCIENERLELGISCEKCVGKNRNVRAHTKSRGIGRVLNQFLIVLSYETIVLHTKVGVIQTKITWNILGGTGEATRIDDFYRGRKEDLLQFTTMCK
jgi:hypothetical protein